MNPANAPRPGKAKVWTRAAQARAGVSQPALDRATARPAAGPDGHRHHPAATAPAVLRSASAGAPPPVRHPVGIIQLQGVRQALAAVFQQGFQQPHEQAVFGGHGLRPVVQPSHGRGDQPVVTDTGHAGVEARFAFDGDAEQAFGQVVEIDDAGACSNRRRRRHAARLVAVDDQADAENAAPASAVADQVQVAPLEDAQLQAPTGEQHGAQGKQRQ